MSKLKFISKYLILFIPKAAAIIKLKKDKCKRMAYLQALESTLVEWHSKNDMQDYHTL